LIVVDDQDLHGQRLIQYSSADRHERAVDWGRGLIGQRLDHVMILEGVEENQVRPFRSDLHAAHASWVEVEPVGWLLPLARVRG
jgi:hypothetical protein